MAVQVLDENGIVRTLPEVSEVGARIDEKVQANMPEDGADGKDGLSIWETTTNTTTGTTSIAISTLNKVAGRSVQVGDYIIGNATYSYLYLVTAVNSTTVTVTYRRTLRGATGSGGSVTVDTTLSSTSENPVQNKVINAALTNGSVTKVGTATKGSSTQPIYLNAGTPTACSRTIPSITLNGSSTTAPSFYAPTVDTGGRWLRGTGLGEPEWALPINIQDSYTEISSNKTVPDLGVGHTGIICYFTSHSSSYTIYLPNSGEWSFAYIISNPYSNGKDEQLSSAKSIAWRNSAVSGGNAMCTIKGNGKYTSVMIIYTRLK